MENADDLFLHVANGGNGPRANELLGRFFAGYPLEKLQLLLQSSNDEAAQAGAFIASELGLRFRPLIAELPAMLNHRLKNVRFDALDVVLNTETLDDEVLAKAVALIRDSDEAVRRQTLRFLARATEGQLAAGARALGDSEAAMLLTWLAELSSTSMADSRKQVKEKLDSVDPLARQR